MSESHQIELGYWAIRGRGEPARLLLRYTEIGTCKVYNYIRVVVTAQEKTLNRLILFSSILTEKSFLVKIKIFWAWGGHQLTPRPISTLEEKCCHRQYFG